MKRTEFGTAATPHAHPISRERQPRDEVSSTEPPREPRSKLVLDSGLDLPEGIRRAVEEVRDYALLMVERAPDDPTRSVHEYRKSIRRMRALVKLLRSELGEDRYGSLNAALRDAVGETSSLRDAAVVLDALESLEIAGSSPAALAAGSYRETLRDEIAQEAQSDDVVACLRRSAVRLDGVVSSFAAGLPADLDAPTVTQAFRGAFGAVERGLQRVLARPKPDRIHSWRKRVKELRYQLELVRDSAGKKLKRDQKRLARLAERLGEVTDLLILRSRIRARAAESDGEAGSALRPLERRLSKEIRRRLKKTLPLGKRALADGPRRFSRRLARSLPQPRGA